MNTDHQHSRLDTAFSQFLAQHSTLNKTQKTDFKTIIAELSFQQSQGHSCICINDTDQHLIQASGLLTDNPALSPLVLEKNRLYLQRYWFYEYRLAQQVKKLLTQSFSRHSFDSLLSRYFSDLIDETDWQKEATKKALSNAFTIITGGPGTGKTSTVVKILALLQELAGKDGHFLHIALATPTGKAATRLQQSIGLNKNTLPCSELIKQQVPETVTTLHRLLGAQSPSPYFKHNANNPLPHDLIVVDEASMVDLALMSKLLDALKPNSRLILLGDKDQLASVESGAVLADLTTALPEYTVELKKSYRFKGEIKALADAVNNQSIEKAWEVLDNADANISLLNIDLIDYATEQYSDYLLQIKDNIDFKTIFTTFSQFQLLCSNRQGDNGVISINKKVEEKLVQQNKIQISGHWYIGRPVMITQNNSALHLYNGDIGICLLDKESAKLAIFFQHPDGSVKKVLPSRVPEHETVFAMTIHKSQGSEFDECVCVLADKINPVLSKELIYTAITRAKTRLKIVSSYLIFKQTLQQSVVRTGGLLEKLKENM